ncbi:hypothetical protein BamIOP4010DRAFT_4361 [Burkholderia ambifaria IOP40-10]|uniref:Uncharacterized protein n=1 Tax=Burkholderia ambifaria IOP40-10 TaxID=396596 RepID=B1FK00_9BURK|nr:hypothetical protein [Burkholderia ambifaria]EDT02115.1 hypothetical protein BamIOP4010DRAFT_4361 [Burkholderia ambifaria IOP40-10]
MFGVEKSGYGWSTSRTELVRESSADSVEEAEGMGSDVESVQNGSSDESTSSVVQENGFPAPDGSEPQKRRQTIDSSTGQSHVGVDAGGNAGSTGLAERSNVVTKWQTTKATLSAMGRTAAAQVAGHAVGMGLDLAVQTLLVESEAALLAGTVLVPTVVGVAGAYLGYRYTMSQFPMDGVRSKLSAISAAVLAALGSYATLPTGAAASRAAGIAGVVNSVVSNGVMAEVASALRKAGPRMVLADPSASAGGWAAYLAPWAGLMASAGGAVGTSVALPSRTVLGGIGAALHGAVLGAMTKAAVATVANRCAATEENPVVYKPHEAMVERPDHSAVGLRAAWSTAMVGVSNLLSPALKNVMHRLDEAPKAYDICSALGSAVASNSVSKIIWGWVDDTSKSARRVSPDREDTERALTQSVEET